MKNNNRNYDQMSRDELMELVGTDDESMSRDELIVMAMEIDNYDKT